tara:strand:- start:1170 stop:1370 length:201 start_codon:yes stop_codon:yes gene_type:complete
MNIWKNINIDYGKFYVAQLDKSVMNFSKTRFVIDYVINRPFNTLKDAREFKTRLTKDFKYVIVKKQ